MERSGEEWRGVERNGEEWRGMERSGEGRSSIKADEWKQMIFSEA
jgi:hypothetical protein